MDETPKSQHDRFLETARALGCDENESAFDEKLKMVARQRPILQSKLKLKAKPETDENGG